MADILTAALSIPSATISKHISGSRRIVSRIDIWQNASFILVCCVLDASGQGVNAPDARQFTGEFFEYSSVGGVVGLERVVERVLTSLGERLVRRDLNA
ncbi:hypothetical protein R3P38DRAFT_3167758 [Favolaschia claudopus]|uniref:Uncharacterized protein n=1 Tax=Favolaschia claudopus TaxID=2862362 RepID=A0AAW0E5W1_9AGAR